MKLVQVNLQTHFGGAEAYAATCCRAMACLGIPSTLIISAKAQFWESLDLGGRTTLLRSNQNNRIQDLFRDDAPTWLLAHSPLPDYLKVRAPNRLISGCAHMPVQGRDTRSYEGYDLLYPVSLWVQQGLIDIGLPSWRGEPLYGIADMSSRSEIAELRRTSRYDWDLRKGRDRLLSLIAPGIEKLRAHPIFEKKPGLTLGVVSRITPIKQFPLLFSKLAPILARHPDVNLEVFGAGGFASVRDLSVALRPCADQARFWGHQRHVASVYRHLDCLLPGLPEKEAFPLNVVEAQICGIPVIAVNAPPFTEGIAEDKTGYFYKDPREDDGADFERVLSRIKVTPRLDPRTAIEHLARFGFDAFVKRLRPVVADAMSRLNAPGH